MRKIYPAIFHKEDNGYWVEFPDLPGCNTQGDTLEEAMTMSEEVLGLYLIALEEDKKPLPEASNPSDIQIEKGDFVSLITTNINLYRRNKAVKKTLTIPQWLNDEAMSKGVNFSQTLQNALLEELRVSG